MSDQPTIRRIRRHAGIELDGRMIDAFCSVLADTGATVSVSPGRTYTLLDAGDVYALVGVGSSSPRDLPPAGPVPFTHEELLGLLAAVDFAIRVPDVWEVETLRDAREKLRARL